MTPPLFSIVVPTHNRPELLAEALDSLRRQHWTDFEVIVVDDASEPAVRAEAIAPVHGRPVQVMSHARALGGAASKSAGAARAQGEWVAFLDDDDLYEPDFLSSLQQQVSGRNDVDVCFVDVAWFGEGSAPAASEASHRGAAQAVIASTRHRCVEGDLVLFEDGLVQALIRSTPMQFQRPVVRRNGLQRVGLFRPECLMWDCDWAIRAALLLRCAYLARPVYRQREGMGYFTRPGRVVQQAASIHEIAQRLRRQPPRPLQPDESASLRRAEAEKAFDLAYVQAEHGETTAALRHWARSQWLQPSLRTLKFPLGVAWRRLRGQPQ
jgi:glycosyltransferase involved in cell wall biosynthesis